MLPIEDGREPLFEAAHLERSWRYVYRPEFVPLLLAYLGIKPGMRILEAGAGTAFLSRLIAKNVDGVRIIALEKNEESVLVGQAVLAQEKLGEYVTLRQGDSRQLPYPDNSFDLATSQNML